MSQPIETRRPLNARQQAVLDFIRHYIKAHGESPTVGEIGRALGLDSYNIAFKSVTQLIMKHYIVQIPSTTRGIRILDPVPG